MRIETSVLLHLLTKLKLASSYSSKYNIINPVWSSVIFDGKRKKAIIFGRGFQFAVETNLPVEDFPSFIVDFDRFRSVLQSVSDSSIDLEVGTNTVNISSSSETFKLKTLRFDYEKYLIEEPDDRLQVSNLSSLFDFVITASSSNPMDYLKYGIVITDKGFIYATDDVSLALGYYDFTTIGSSFLIQYPLFLVFQQLGEVSSLSVKGDTCFISLEMGIGISSLVKTPIIKIEYNPTIHQYVKSFSKDVVVSGITVNLLRKLSITLDDSFQVVDLYKKGNKHLLKSSSSLKGETNVVVEDVEGALDRNVQFGIQPLRKLARFFEKFYIDLDNLVVFAEEENRMFAFGLSRGK